MVAFRFRRMRVRRAAEERGKEGVTHITYWMGNSVTYNTLLGTMLWTRLPTGRPQGSSAARPPSASCRFPRVLIRRSYISQRAHNAPRAYREPQPFDPQRHAWAFLRMYMRL